MLEGYPVDTEGQKRPGAALWHGTVRLFEGAGFAVAARHCETRRRRPVARWSGAPSTDALSSAAPVAGLVGGGAVDSPGTRVDGSSTGAGRVPLVICCTSWSTASSPSPEPGDRMIVNEGWV